MIKYLSKVLYVLSSRKRSLILLLCVFAITSSLEALGIGLIGPFLNLASRPDAIFETPLLANLYRYLEIQEPRQFIPVLGLTIIIIFCAKSVFYFFARAYIFHFSYSQKSILISRLLEAYLKAPYTFYLSRNTATIIKNIIGETNKFVLQCLLPILTGTSNLIVIALLLLVLAQTDLLLLIMIMAIILPTFLVFQKLGNKFTAWGKTKSVTNREMIRVINHGLGGVKEMRVIGCELYFEEQMERQTAKFARAATLFQTSQILPRILIETTLVIFLLGFISVSFMYSEQSIQELTGVMGVFAVATVRLIPSSTQLIGSLAQLRNSSYALDSLYLDLYEIEKSQKSQGGVNRVAVNSKPAEGKVMDFSQEIQLADVTYSYPATAEPAIKDISLTIKKGQSVALIGKSGAGKTTLVDVILGLLDPESGDILVDGKSIYQNIRVWQNLVGYIPQAIFLTDDTVERNIAFGVSDSEIDPERLGKAIEAAQLTELVADLPKGIKTKVGERGVRLSGGQRQRIGIARALYHEREILVLDEATSALDNETERLVSEAINSLAGTKTMIIIAHRLSTVENCDFVYLLEQGSVVKSGSYEEVVLEA